MAMLRLVINTVPNYYNVFIRKNIINYDLNSLNLPTNIFMPTKANK
jgi:hypothetical protein